MADIDVARLVEHLRTEERLDTTSSAWRAGVRYAIECIEAEADGRFDLEPVPGAEYAECPTCDSRLMVEPGTSVELEHMPRGEHAVRITRPVPGREP